MNINTLIQNSKLEIVQYGIDIRNNLQNKNREFNCYIVSYIKHGTCRLHLEGEDYHAKPGDVLFIPPGVKHDHVKDSNDETCFIWWHFNFKYCNAINVLSLYNIPICFHINDSQLLEQVLEEYITLDNTEKGISKQILKEAKSLELIGRLLDLVLTKQDQTKVNEESGIFMDILLDLSKDLSKPMNLKMLAQKYHMHPTYITNRFKEMYNITPIQMQLQLRLEEAKKLLAYNSIPISQVANMVGYEDASDFTRFFKLKEGLSPIQYRKYNKKEFE